MFDFIFSELPHYIAKAVEFIVWGVLVGYILRKWVGEMLIKLGKKLAAKNERNMAIWQHYMNRVDGRGHDHGSVLDCHEGKCKVFTQYA